MADDGGSQQSGLSARATGAVAVRAFVRSVPDRLLDHAQARSLAVDLVAEKIAGPRNSRSFHHCDGDWRGDNRAGPADGSCGTVVCGGPIGVGLLYLLAGIFGPRFRFDLMSVFYWSSTALACAALLVFEGVIR